MNGRPVIIGLFATAAVIAGASVYLRATVHPVDRASQTILSPDKQHKAVGLSLWSNGKAPFCYHTVAVLPAQLPDRFAESEKTYQVYFADCAVPYQASQAPAVAWTGNDALRITYTPPPAGFTDVHTRRREVDASGGVQVSYRERQ